MDLRVGSSLVQPARNRVVRDGCEYHVTPKTMDVLLCLVHHEGQPVSKDELVRQVWAGTFVSDDALVRCVGELRKVLGDDARSATVIETIPKRGYRLAAPIAWEKPEPAVEIPPPESAASASPRFWTRRRALSGGALLLGTAFTAGLARPLRRRWDAWRARPAIRALVVLPLVNLSRNADEDYFAEGMTEALIIELSRIRALRVISHSSALRYKDRKKPLAEIARELNIDAAVEGTVLRAGQRVRITAQLIDAQTGVNLWSGSFEQDVSNVLAIQSGIARAITGELSVNLHPQERARLNASRRVVPEAYEAFLKGSYFLERQQFRKSAEYLEIATVKDPEFALAHALLFEADGMQDFVVDRPLSARAAKALQRAGELDDTLAEVHSGRGDLLFYGEWRWAEGEAEFRRAVELDPRSTFALLHYAGCLSVQRRWDESIAVFRRAMLFDPVSLRLNTGMLRTLIDSRQETAAADQLRKAMEIDAAHPSVWDAAAVLHATFGRPDEAIACWLKAEGLREKSGARLQALADAARAGGIRGFWLKRLEAGQPPSAVGYARALILAGRPDDASRVVEDACQRRLPPLPWVNARVEFEPLRAHPRFQSVLRRMGLWK